MAAKFSNSIHPIHVAIMTLEACQNVDYFDYNEKPSFGIVFSVRDISVK
jgi:hypothetical protein